MAGLDIGFGEVDGQLRNVNPRVALNLLLWVCAEMVPLGKRVAIKGFAADLLAVGVIELAG